MIDPQFTRRGFLPGEDPLRSFPPDSEFHALEGLGHDLPSLLQEKGFLRRTRAWQLPALPASPIPLETLRLYYVRLGFLASAYVNQVGFEPASVLPHNIALPLCDVCARLGRPPILSYDGYALFNWKRFDPAGPITLGNIDTIQNFVHLYDEHWFILVHVEIEALAARRSSRSTWPGKGSRPVILPVPTTASRLIARTLWAQVETLRRIPEKMDPALYYKTFRPYIRFFEGVVYEGVDSVPMDFRGETGAQSSVIPTVVAFFKIPHRRPCLRTIWRTCGGSCPREHRALIEQVETHAGPTRQGGKGPYNEALEAVATFRETHFEFARRYIDVRRSPTRGTGGTPYLKWLGQLIHETRVHAIP